MPPMINPQVIGALMAQQGGQPGGAPPPGAAPPAQTGAMPPTAPVQPQQGGGTGMMSGMQVPDQSQAQPQQGGGDIKGALAEAVAAITAAREHIGNLEGQIKSVPNAPSGFNPNFKPITGQGFGGDLKNLAGDVGKGLVVGLAGATPEGRNIMNTIQAPAKAQRAQSMQKIQEQLEATKSSLGATGQEIGGLGMAAKWNQAERGLDIRQQNADTSAGRMAAYQQSIKDRAANFASTQDWRNASLSEKTRNDTIKAAQEQADEAGRDYRANNRDATEEEVAQVMSGTRKEIANEAAAKDPSVKSWLFSALGLPEAQIQGAASPEMRTPTQAPTASGSGAPAQPKKSSKKAGGPPAGATHAVIVDGKVIGYTSDGKTMTPAQ